MRRPKSNVAEFVSIHSNMMVRGQLFLFMSRKVGSEKLVQKFYLKRTFNFKYFLWHSISVNINLTSSSQHNFVQQVIHFYILYFLLGTDPSLKLGLRTLWRPSQFQKSCPFNILVMSYFDIILNLYKSFKNYAKEHLYTFY